MDTDTKTTATRSTSGRSAGSSLILAMLELPINENASELSEHVPWQDALSVIREHANTRRHWANMREHHGIKRPTQAELPHRRRGPGRGIPFEREPLESVDRRVASFHSTLVARALPCIARLKPGDYPDELVNAGAVPPERRAGGLASECLASDTLWGRREDDPLVVHDVAWGIVRQCVESFLGVPGYRVWRSKSNSEPWVVGLTLVSGNSPHNRTLDDDALGIQAAREEKPERFVDGRDYGELSADDWSEIRQSLAGLLHARLLARSIEKLEVVSENWDAPGDIEIRADKPDSVTALNRGVMAICQQTIMSYLDVETSRALLSGERGLAWIRDAVRDIRSGLVELGYATESVGVHQYGWL